MTDTIALVTGANKGIGYETVKQLAALGMTVVLAARDAKRGGEAAKTLNVDFVQLDVTDERSAKAAAAVVEDRYGRLDVLVNNAGMVGNHRQQPTANDLDSLREVFDTNYFGIIIVTNAMLPLLSKSTAARIVNVSSGVGSLAAMSNPDDLLGGLPASLGYVPSKTAVNSLTIQYAKELRTQGILVNAADPGYCATDLNNNRGHRPAAQGAAVSVYLATLGADGPTGGFFTDDGTVVPW